MKRLLFILLLTACEFVPRPTAGLVYNTTPPIADQMEQWALELEYSQGEPFLHSENPCVVITISLKDLDPPAIGEAYPDGCTVHIDPEVVSIQNKFRSVFIHELGHCFLLPHSDDPTDLMAPLWAQINDASWTRFNYQLRKIRGR